MQPANRYQSLDGLRGVAAFVVVLCHFAEAYLPPLIPDQSMHPLIFADTPLGLIFNGPFAVAVFFVLSGFVVSNSSAKRTYGPLVSTLARYVRLGLPATASILFAWFLLNLFPDGTAHLKALEPHAWLSAGYDGNEPGLLAAIRAGLIGVFFDPPSMTSPAMLFNNPLWTMRIELIGSVGIYLTYSVTGRARWLGIALYALLAIAMRDLVYLNFVAGMLLREFRGQLPVRLGWPALVGALALGWMRPGLTERWGPRHIHILDAMTLPGGAVYILAATMLVFSVLTLRPVQTVFETRPAQFLGRVSFPIYLLHVPLLFTVFATLYGRVSLLALFPVFIATVLALGYVAARWLDEPMLTHINRMKALVRSTPTSVPETI